MVGASALGLDYLLEPQSAGMSQTTTTATSTIQSSEITTSLMNVPTSTTRLLANVDDFRKLAQLVETNDQAQRYFQLLKSDAYEMLRQPPYTYDVCPPNICHDDQPVLQPSRGIVKRIYTLALMYRLTGDTNFSDRALVELKSAAQFPDWNPNVYTFLDTAEVTHAFAIGYDWIPMTEDIRKMVRDAIVTKGLQPALRCYQDTVNFGWWVIANHNWNLVCNGGIGMGALAVSPELPDLSNEILQYIGNSLPIALKSFAPDGAWAEGPVYWSYATLYLSVFLASLSTALGNVDYLKSPGLSETGFFPIYITGPTGRAFNFADAEELGLSTPQLFWLARAFGQSVYSWFANLNDSVANYDLSCSGPCVGRPLGLVWFNPSSVDPQSAGLDMGKYFRGAETATFRSSWTDPDTQFLAFKAGSNQVNHCHLDLGSFVLEALGQRWAIDLGPDLYSLPGYFDTSAERWTYYRMRAEGHNTIVLNSFGGGPDQDNTASTKIIKYSSTPTFQFAIADLVPAYSSSMNPKVQQLERGCGLAADHTIIQDELIPVGAVDFWWFMHTRANVVIGADSRTAMLSQVDKRLWCAIGSPNDATFISMDAKPLPSSPHPSGQDPNYGVQKLAVHLRLTMPTTVSILLYPLQPDQQPPTQLPALNPLSRW